MGCATSTAATQPPRKNVPTPYQQQQQQMQRPVGQPQAGWQPGYPHSQQQGFQQPPQQAYPFQQQPGYAPHAPVQQDYPQQGMPTQNYAQMQQQQHPAYQPQPGGHQQPPYQQQPAQNPMHYAANPAALAPPSYQQNQQSVPPPAYVPPFAYPPEMDEREKEPMLLLDTTGSMNWPISETDSTPRREVIGEVIVSVVSALAAHDSQNEDEGGEGGLRCISFAGQHPKDQGDLNPKNIREKWASITWAGTTHITNGWRELKKTYLEEFGDRPPNERPLMLAVVLTDGDAIDTVEFARLLDQERDGTVYVLIALIGFGEEFDRALSLYNNIAAHHNNVRVLSLGSQTSPQVISNALLTMIR